MRLWKNGLFQLGLLLAAPFLIGALCLNSSFAVNQSIWNNKHISNYTMTVIGLWLPAPASTVQVVVRNGEITGEKLLECEIGQPEYSASTCKTLTTYYYLPDGYRTYTADRLFQIAQMCTDQTNQVVKHYGLPYQIGFTGFISSDALYDFARAYRASLNYSDRLCSVEYDPEYGYPKQIVMYIPNVNDGGSVITVKNFHVDD